MELDELGRAREALQSPDLLPSHTEDADNYNSMGNYHGGEDFDFEGNNGFQGNSNNQVGKCDGWLAGRSDVQTRRGVGAAR